jgi:hypothetical protein
MIQKSTVLFALAAAANLAACSGGAEPTVAAPSAQNAHDAHDAHGTVGSAAVARPDGERWPADEHLRLAMSRIESAVQQAVAEGQPLSRESATELAGTVEENVAFLVKNCRLPPEPDAALHVLIGRMMTAAGQLRGEASSSEAALTQLVDVMRDYRGAFAT